MTPGEDLSYYQGVLANYQSGLSPGLSDRTVFLLIAAGLFAILAFALK